MSLEVNATYENGVLKPDQPLPLSEHTRVTVSIEVPPTTIRQSAGMIAWRGDARALEELLGADNDVTEGV